MVLAQRTLDFEAKWTIKHWAVFIVELDDTAKRLDIMYKMWYRNLSNAERQYHASMGERQVKSIFGIIDTYLDVPLPVKAQGLAAQKQFDESVLKKKAPGQDIELWRDEVVNLIRVWQAHTGQPYFKPPESDEHQVAVSAGVEDTQVDGQWSWQVITRERWMPASGGCSFWTPSQKTLTTSRFSGV
jgi:hypothetical protein